MDLSNNHQVLSTRSNFQVPSGRAASLSFIINCSWEISKSDLQQNEQDQCLEIGLSKSKYYKSMCIKNHVDSDK